MKLVGYRFRTLYRSIRGRRTFPREIKLNWLNTAIPWEKLVNTEIPCQQSTKHRYRIYFLYWVPTNVPHSMALLSNFITFLQVRWPLHALTRNVRWNVCNEIQATHIQSTWRLAEAEFIIINRKNIKLSHSRFLVIERLFFLNLYFTYLFGSRCSSDKWTLSRDNISKIQLSLADGNFELFSFSANLSFSFLF